MKLSLVEQECVVNNNAFAVLDDREKQEIRGTLYTSRMIPA